MEIERKYVEVPQGKAPLLIRVDKEETACDSFVCQLARLEYPVIQLNTNSGVVVKVFCRHGYYHLWSADFR